MRKVVMLEEGEVTITVPDKLSIASCEILEASMTSFLRGVRGRAMIGNELAKLGQSMAANVSNDDKPAS